MVARLRFEPLPIRRIARAVEIQWYPDDLQLAEYLPVRFLLDLVDEPVHRLGDVGEVATKPYPVESGRHRLVLLGADVDDARDVADAAVVVRAGDHRDELVVRVLDVLGVLAVLVAVVLLPVEERYDDHVFESYLERVRAFTLRAGGGNQMISEQWPAAGGVDEDISRLEHRHRVLHG